MGAETKRRKLSEPEEFLHALESVSRGIRDPVAKLRFIRNSLARYRSLDRFVRAVPIAPVRRVFYRWLSLEGLRHLLDTGARGHVPAGHRPEHVEFARRIDVFIDYYDEAPVVGAAEGLRREKERLAGVAGIGLFDRDDIKETADAGF